MNQVTQQDISKKKTKADKIDLALSITANVMIMVLIYGPGIAHAQVGAVTDTFGGITAFLKSITNLLIFEWGYYIGILTLAIQGYRWKTGRIDLLALGGWGLGLGIVFFAPNIVADLKARSSGTVG